jgi:primosomal protein N' (replication factor Y)
MALVAEVVFPRPLPHGYDYAVPEAFAGALSVGQRVWAPLGKKPREIGVVVNLRESDADAPVPLKPLLGPVEPEVSVDDRDLKLARWIAERTGATPGEAVFGVLPLGKKPPPKRRLTPKPAPVVPPEPPLTPTPDQAAAIEALTSAVDRGAPAAFLLWGVAASGKTEVYLRAAEAALARGRSVIYLVPEIGLTPQVERLVRARFGAQVAVWHSDVPDGERWRIWRDAREGVCRVLVGARSALFVPLWDLGLIIVDEEHDASYKQDGPPHHNARDAALEKARLHGAVAVLGSATPSLETHARVDAGELRLLSLSRRAAEGSPPTVRIVDLRRSGWYLSDDLVNAIRERLERREQSLLLLNRRGWATYIHCGACGWVARCPLCATALVHHRPLGGTEELRCHTCEHRAAPPRLCPSCRQPTVKDSGRGTQRLAGDLALLFPAARILRWDRDTTAKRGGHREAFDAVRSDAVDIVVGTQMIAQGLDFPRMTLVGVVDADRPLRLPDFRAGERAYQLLAQVAGRAGRADRPGEVILQTRNPEHPALRAAGGLDYRAFVESELAARREMNYPPFRRLALLTVRARQGPAAEKGAEALRTHLESITWPPSVQFLGPAPGFQPQPHGWHQWRILAKASAEDMPAVLAALRERPALGSARLVIDADPEEP